jgi:uncharacterized membrane protein YphA (DoxX/SURF4 family)
MFPTLPVHPTPPFGHVSYVVDPAKLEALAGTDWDFLLSPVRDPFYLTLIGVTFGVTIALFAVGEVVRPARTACRRVHDRFLAYDGFVPLILRTALGIALIVAGTKQAVFLPNVSAPEVSTLQVVLGFCLLAGFSVRICGLGAVVLFGYGLTKSHYLFGSMESAAAGLIVAAYGAAAPCTDDILQMDPLGRLLAPLWKRVRDHTGTLLRLSLGCTMLWLAVTEKAMNPRVCEAVVIDFDLQKVIPVSSAMWVFTVGVIEFAVGLVLVLGLFTRTWSIVAFLVLTLSFFYFKEEVAGHVTFFGALMVLMIKGAGDWSCDSLIARRSRGAIGTVTPYETEVTP